MLPHNRFFDIKDDFRDPFARDRDRVIHSGSFRRLEYKTQVFLNSVGDYFRTRLTHSLEVSQISRSIAKNLGLNEALAEVIALSHDLGHTPFGHAGGDELDRVLKSEGFSNGFEHNYQSFRVVTKLEKRYSGFDGLNLTYATLEGILKHSYPYKKSFIDSKIEDMFKLDKHPSLEAMVVDNSDEIAYVSHDIDDGIKCNLISFEDLKKSELVRDVIELVKKEGIEEKNKVFRYRFSAHLINTLVYDFLENSKGCKHIKSEPISSKIDATTELEFGFSEEMKRKIKLTKKILFDKLYKNEFVVSRMFFGKLCIKSLYEAFDSDSRLLPFSLVEKIEDGQKKHRVIADYIASMSDRFASEKYKELYLGG